MTTINELLEDAFGIGGNNAVPSVISSEGEAAVVPEAAKPR